jgi:hypothetical protein
LALCEVAVWQLCLQGDGDPWDESEDDVPSSPKAGRNKDNTGKATTGGGVSLGGIAAAAVSMTAAATLQVLILICAICKRKSNEAGVVRLHHHMHGMLGTLWVHTCLCYACLKFRVLNESTLQQRGDTRHHHVDVEGWVVHTISCTLVLVSDVRLQRT